MSNQNVKISFIPKEPLLRGDTIVRKRPAIGLSFLIGFIIFVIAFSVAGGVYYYKKVEYQNLLEIQEQLKETNDELELSNVIQSIEDIRTLRDQIDQVSVVLDKHLAMTALFTFLETTTLTDVSFNSFNLSVINEGEANIIMSGQAKSYATIGNQSEVYSSQSDILRSFSLENFVLTENGTISFNFSGVINLEKLYYLNTIDIITQPEMMKENIDEDVEKGEE